MTENTEFAVKLALSLLALVAAVLHARRADGERAGALLAAAAAVALAAFTNFFTFHSGLFFTHVQDGFHYHLGSKYFPELGYDGLYEASVVAQAESDPRLAAPRRIRDLHTNTIIPASDALARRSEIVARFSPARWKSFLADNSYFSRSIVAAWADTRMDHGYNPTPAWTFVGRLFNAWLPLDGTTVPLLALLDWVLIATVLVVVRGTYGGAAAASFAILFGLGYPWRYAWVGGAFLRYDWFAAIVIGICLLRRRSFAAAGALFAYATAVRVFPAILLAGIGAVAARELVRRRSVRWLMPFAGGFLAALGGCFLAGAATGRGFAAWEQFRANIRKHHDTWSINTAGLELLILHGPTALFTKPADWPLAQGSKYTADVERTPAGGYVVSVPAAGVRAEADTLDKARVIAEDALDRAMMHWQNSMTRVHEDRRRVFAVAAALAIGALLLAAWQRTADEAVLLGVIAVFSLLCLSCYYWVLLALMPLDRRARLALPGMLALNAATYAVALAVPEIQYVYLFFTCGVTLLFAVRLGPDVVATLQGRDAVPVAAAAATGPPSSKHRVAGRKRR